METFSALLAICAGNSPPSGEFPAQRPVTRSSDVFFDLCLNKRLRKQSWGWWFETLSRPLWRHCNEKEHTYSAPSTLFGNTLKLKRNGRHFADVILLYEIWLDFHWNMLQESSKQKSSMAQVMAWRRTGDKPLSEPMIYQRIYTLLGFDERTKRLNIGHATLFKSS